MRFHERKLHLFGLLVLSGYCSWMSSLAGGPLAAGVIGGSPFEKIEQTNRNWSAFTFTTFEVYLFCGEVTEMLLEYVGLMTVLLLSACWFMSSL
jgi:hypothetical protein